MRFRVANRRRILSATFRATLLAAVLSLLGAGQSLAADIESVRLWRAPDSTRLVLDLSAAVEHQLFTLENPYRIVIDIQDAELKANLDSLDVTSTPINEIRSGPSRQ